MVVIIVYNVSDNFNWTCRRKVENYYFHSLASTVENIVELPEHFLKSQRQTFTGLSPCLTSSGYRSQRFELQPSLKTLSAEFQFRDSRLRLVFIGQESLNIWDRLWYLYPTLMSGTIKTSWKTTCRCEHVLIKVLCQYKSSMMFCYVSDIILSELKDLSTLKNI